MKKKLAVFLAIILLLGSLAGCTQAELGYLDAAAELLEVTSGEVSGTITVHADVAALSKALEAFEEGSELAELGKSMLYDGQELQVDLEIFYSGQFDVMTGAMELALSARMDQKDYDLGTLAVGEDGSMAISKQMLFAAMNLMEAMNPENAQAYTATSKYKDELKAQLADCEYIGMAFDYDGYGAATGLAQVTMVGGNLPADILDAAIIFLKDAHKDFSTQMVRKVGGDYEFQMKLSDLPGLLNAYLTYMDKNREPYYSALIQYINAIEKFLSEEWGEEISSTQEPLFTLDDWNSAMEYLPPQLKPYIDELAKDEAILAFGDSYLKRTINNTGGGRYRDSQAFGLVINGQTPISIEMQTDIAQKQVKVEVPEFQMTPDQINAILAELSAKYNKVVGAGLSWHDAEYDWIDSMWMNVDTAQAEPIWSNWGKGGIVYYENVDETLYVNLADVCDALEETLYWNSNIDKAYVAKDGAFIYLDGFQKDQSTWIKIRELEKLGYLVTYEKDEYNYNTVRLEMQEKGK